MRMRGYRSNLSAALDTVPLESLLLSSRHSPDFDTAKRNTSSGVAVFLELSQLRAPKPVVLLSPLNPRNRHESYYSTRPSQRNQLQ